MRSTVAAAVAAVAVATASSACGGGGASHTAQTPGQSPLNGATPEPSANQPSPDADSSTADPRRLGVPTRLLINDPPNDVDFSRDDSDETHRGRHPRADLRRVTIAYTSGTVKVTEHIANLRPTDDHTFRVQLRGPHLTLTYFPILNAGGHPTLIVETWDLSHADDSDGESIRCPGASARASYERNLVVFVVPSACFGSPPWIRLSASDEVDGPDDELRDDELDGAHMKRDGYSTRIHR